MYTAEQLAEWELDLVKREISLSKIAGRGNAETRWNSSKEEIEVVYRIPYYKAMRMSEQEIFQEGRFLANFVTDYLLTLG